MGLARVKIDRTIVRARAYQFLGTIQSIESVSGDSREIREIATNRYIGSRSEKHDASDKVRVVREAMFNVVVVAVVP